MKKLNKLVAILIAMAMVLSLGVVSAFAADPVPTAKEFKLTKILEMPDGTTTPLSEFKWAVTAVTKENASEFNTENVGSDNTPTATQPVINFSKGYATTDADDKDGKIEATATKTDAEIFTEDYAPGKYVYHIKETPNTNTNDGQNTYTYSPTEYMVNMYVDANGDKTYTLWTREDSTKSWVKDSLEDKTEGSEDKVANADFTNTYVYTTKVTPNGDKNTDNDATGFALEKEVTKDEGKLFDNTDFTFNVKVTRPSLSTKETYTYDIVKGDTKVEENQTISATKTDTTPITLKTGERLVFKDLDVGAVVTVNETANSDFTTTAKLNNDAVYTADSEIKVAQTTKKYLKYTNEYNKGSTGPEGILISNLPYIALALVAVGGLVAYVVVRRKADDEA